jgi:hypothetical protein
VTGRSGRTRPLIAFGTNVTDFRLSPESPVTILECSVRLPRNRSGQICAATPDRSLSCPISLRERGNASQAECPAQDLNHLMGPKFSACGVKIFMGSPTSALIGTLNRRLRTLSESLHPARREPDQLGRIPELQFGLDIGAVCFDRLDTHGELSSDRCGALAATDQLEDLKLPIGQGFQCPAGTAPGSLSRSSTICDILSLR